MEISEVLARQDGVISRRQVLAAGGDDNLLARMVRRRQWARVHAGVYADHTGPLSWQQRAWAAVLYAEPAALGGTSALRAHGVRGYEDRSAVHVVVGPDRRLRQPRDVRIERITGFERVVQSNLSPPRVRVEHALVSVASAARSDDAAVGVLADGCQSRRSTPSRLADELRQSPRVRRRHLLLTVVDDVASGAMSALERRYLVDVERAHGFPQGRRQHTEDTSSGRVQRDVEYVEQATLLELDGRLGHDQALDRWANLLRDLDAATTGRLTLRAGWGQVLQPCQLAHLIAQVLTARGWAGSPRPCGPGCPVG